MYLKKIDGPRTVTLPDGSMMSRADLPPADTCRWVMSRKVAVIKGVASGLLTSEQACKIYGLSQEEFKSWCKAILVHGPKALKVTSLQKYRHF